jgi:hypothetical protein
MPMMMAQKRRSFFVILPGSINRTMPFCHPVCTPRRTNVLWYSYYTIQGVSCQTAGERVSFFPFSY